MIVFSVNISIYQKMLHLIFHVDDHLVGLRQIFVGPSTLESEESHSREISPKLVLFSLEIADFFPQLADLQCLKRCHLYLLVFVI
jgi:hypothetical protein